MGYDMQIEEPRDGLRDEGYFRLNIAAMGWARNAMWRAGMLVEGEPAPYPVYADYADDREYEQAIDSWTAQGVEKPGIPVFKLCSNDGWLVTGQECREALDLYGRSGRPEPGSNAELWGEWIRFLTDAAECGGFRVW